MKRRRWQRPVTPLRRWTSLLAAVLLIARSPSAALAQALFARGDATCDATRTAADVVATVRAIVGDSVCNNDDCDRDGILTAADPACAADCLFGPCAVSPAAPRIVGVTPESTSAIVPLSLIHVQGTNFGSAERPKRVLIGGVPAPLAELIPPDMLEVVVPFGLPPGPTTLVVIDGELASPPLPVTIATAEPHDPPDTLDSTLDLIDSAAALLQGLDLENGVGDDAPLLRQQLVSFRADLAEQRVVLASDPGFTPDAAAAINAALDASGLPDLLRQSIAEAQGASGSSADGGSVAQGTVAVRVAVGAIGGTMRVVGGAVAAAGTGTGAAISTPVIIAAAIIGATLIAAGSYYAGLRAARNAPIPTLVSIAYRDGMGASRIYPTVGGAAYVTARDASSSTDLIFTTAFGAIPAAFESQQDDVLVYRLPDTSGLCGKATVELRVASGASNPLSTSLQPLLLDTSDARAYPKQRLLLDTDGVSPCEPVFGAFLLPGSQFQEVAAEESSANSFTVPVPALPPAPGYEVLVKVDGVPSQEPYDLEIVNAPTAMLACDRTDLTVSPGAPSSTACTLTIEGKVLPHLQYSWISSDQAIAPVNNVNALTTTVAAGKAGHATLKVLLVVEPEIIAESNTVTINVADQVPTLSVACDPTQLLVAPGMPSTATCTLTTQPADATLPEGSAINWLSSDAGTATVDGNATTATVTANAPGSTNIRARLAKGDTALAESNDAAITVDDRTGPTVTLSTMSASSVKAGASIDVRVRADDNVQVDRLVLNVSGDAVSSVSPSAEVPCLPQKRCTATFTVNLKDMGFTNQQVSVSADAFDEKGNQGSAAALGFTIVSDTMCPDVAILQPANGGRVRAGDTVQISARVTDNRPGDTGVRRVIVNATGAAVATGPNPVDVTLPMALPQATRLVTFTVVNDLSAVADPTITITANAADDAGNLCAQPQTVTVTAGGAPQITGVSPNPVSAGANVTISGQAFGATQDSGSVSIAGANAAVQSWSNNTIVAQVPSTASGDVTVSVTAGGEVSNSVPLKVLGTGDVQVTLSWSDTNDIDLHVVDPNGEEIYYGNRLSASGGQLDVDANGGCGNTTSSPRENIFWPTGQAPAGTYQVNVVYFESCSEQTQSTGITVVAKIGAQTMTLIQNASLGPGGTLSAMFSR